mmetsp:Transcript_23716/g.51851  ORF Transcript_23716/g.51851 Transcript_23716/m.51851 type:complete len:300 (-) Transcript_23716:381-1280(-)
MCKISKCNLTLGQYRARSLAALQMGRCSCQRVRMMSTKLGLLGLAALSALINTMASSRFPQISRCMMQISTTAISTISPSSNRSWLCRISCSPSMTSTTLRSIMSSTTTGSTHSQSTCSMLRRHSSSTIQTTTAPQRWCSTAIRVSRPRAGPRRRVPQRRRAWRWTSSTARKVSSSGRAVHTSTRCRRRRGAACVCSLASTGALGRRPLASPAATRVRAQGAPRSCKPRSLNFTTRSTSSVLLTLRDTQGEAHITASPGMLVLAQQRARGGAAQRASAASRHVACSQSRLTASSARAAL